MELSQHLTATCVPQTRAARGRKNPRAAGVEAGARDADPMHKLLRGKACIVGLPFNAWVKTVMVAKISCDPKYGGKVKAHERFLGGKPLVAQPDLDLSRSTVIWAEQSASPLLRCRAVDAVDAVSADDVEMPVVD